MAHLSRRKLLTAIPVLTPAAVGAITIITDRAEAALADPIVALAAERRRLIAIVNGDGPADEAEAAFHRECAVDRKLATSRPTSVAGALAAIALIREEYLAYHYDESDPCPGDHLVLGLIDGVERILTRATIA